MATIDYQQDGFVSGFSSKSLNEANRQLAVARKATPEALREKYRAQIRGVANGYAWYWVRK